MMIQIATVSIMRKMLKGKDDDDCDNDVNIYNPPNNNNYNNYTIMKSILTGHQPSKHMVCRAPGPFVYPSFHPPYFLWYWNLIRS